MAKSIGVKDFLQSKKEALQFDGVFEALLGKPERSGSWIIWGNPGNGKTRFAIQLSKYLCQFGSVLYNSLEEGDSLSLQKAFREERVVEVSKKLILVDGEDIEELTVRLSKPKSANIVVIDSLQYTSLTYKAYKAFKRKFRKKLFIFISHAEGKEPKGSLARSIRYDSNCKIRVEGFIASAISRYGGGTPYIVYEKGAIEHHGEAVLNSEGNVMYHDENIDHHEEYNEE